MTQLIAQNYFYAGREINFDLSLELKGITMILGANGAGKTSYLETLHGIRAGRVFWGNNDAQITKHLRGYVSQNPIFFDQTVMRNLRDACALLKIPTSKHHSAIESACTALGVKTPLSQSIQALSGGEQALIAVARAILHAPKGLLLDEVTANLDPVNTQQIENYLIEFAKREAHYVLAVSHSLMQTRRIADNIIFLDQGDVVYFGAASKFWNAKDERIQNYLSGGAQC